MSESSAATARMMSCPLPEFRKRPLDLADSNVEKECKKSKYYIMLEPESELSSCEESESIHSIQGRETDVVKDTSDTSSTYSNWTDDSEMKLEFEVASLSERENPFGIAEMDSSSGPDDVIRATATLKPSKDDDLDLWADSSESEKIPAFDPEVPRQDYWTCLQCKSQNNNPMFRYCEKCYRLRKNFFPPRPRRGSRRKVVLTSELQSSQPCTTSSDHFCDMLPVLNTCGGSLEKSSSQLTTESGYASSVSLSQHFSPDRSENTMNTDSSNLCVICTERPKDGIFVHKKVGHICCCYTCAVKAYNLSGQCPLCSRKVMSVLKAFVG